MEKEPSEGRIDPKGASGLRTATVWGWEQIEHWNWAWSRVDPRAAINSWAGITIE